MTLQLPIKTICLVCGSKISKVRLRTDEYSIYECQRCNLAWTAPADYVTTSSYDVNPQLSFNYSLKEELSSIYARELLDTIPKQRRNGKLLDIGCSVGTLLGVAENMGFRAEGIDLDENAIAAGRLKSRNVNYAEIAEWEGGPYDVLTLQHTLEHVQAPLEFLVSCAKLLKQDGMLLISVPCHKGLLPCAFPKKWYGWQPRQHFYHYSRASISSLLKLAGLDTVVAVRNSMDHRLTFENLKIRGIVKGLILFATAKAGGIFNAGDQLTVLARKPS